MLHRQALDRVNAEATKRMACGIAFLGDFWHARGSLKVRITNDARPRSQNAFFLYAVLFFYTLGHKEINQACEVLSFIFFVFPTAPRNGRICYDSNELFFAEKRRLTSCFSRRVVKKISLLVLELFAVAHSTSGQKWGQHIFDEAHFFCFGYKASLSP